MASWFFPLACFLVILHLRQVSGSSCFPAEWSGLWFCNKQVINISQSAFGSKGRCLRRQGIRYLIETERKGSRCYICMVFFYPHRNIIEYKESSICSGRRRPLTTMCRSIDGDAPLHTMVRMDATPVSCPFSGHFSFSYRRAQRRSCQSPMSSMSSCSNDSRLVLHYQACVDVVGAEALSEHFTCLATWNSFERQYVFAWLDSVRARSLADRYRCYMYQELSDGVYGMVQSADSTCQGLQTVEDGYRVYRLHKLHTPKSACFLPSWLTSHHKWRSMDGTQVYHVFHQNHSISVSVSRLRSEDGDTEDRVTSWFHLLCSDTSSISSDGSEVQLIVQRRDHCLLGFQCLRLMRRHTSVVQIQYGRLVFSADAACHSFDDSHDPVTLLAMDWRSGSACPLSGRFEVKADASSPSSTLNSCRHSDVSLVASCDLGRSDRLRFDSDCNIGHTQHEYRCHGDWANKNSLSRYVVVSASATSIAHSQPPPSTALSLSGSPMCLRVTGRNTTAHGWERPVSLARFSQLQLFLQDCAAVERQVDREFRSAQSSAVHLRHIYLPPKWTLNITRQGGCRVGSLARDSISEASLSICLSPLYLPLLIVLHAAVFMAQSLIHSC